MRTGGKDIWIVSLMMATLATGNAVFAQRPAGQSPTPAPPPNMPQATSKDTTSTQQTPVPQVSSKKENAAIKTFRDAPASDPDKKTQLGEDFLQNYAQSRYRVEVIDWEAKLYLTKGQVDKLHAAAERELALVPNNPQALADICSNFSRALNPNTPDLRRHLDEAELTCKKALEVLATVQKSADVTEEVFTLAKNQTSAMAYSGLGVVAYRRGKYADAISNMEQAVKLEKTPDPVNYYILGKADAGASHFTDAIAAFTKCAAIPGGLQSPCNSSIDEAKSMGSSHLDAPK